MKRIKMEDFWTTGQWGFSRKENNWATIGVNDDAGLEEVKTAYKNYIKELYDAEKPIVVNYILAEPIERNLTQSEIQAY